MSALNTDLLRKAAPLFATQLESSIADSDTTIPLQSITGLPLDTAVTLTIDATDSNGNPTPDNKETVTGVVNASPTELINCTRGLDNTTAQSHSTGASVVQWFTANDWNDVLRQILTNHVQLGYHQTLQDINGNTWVGQTAAVSAVNYLNVSNSAAGNAITLSSAGSDPNIGLNIATKGTGVVQLNGNNAWFWLGYGFTSTPFTTATVGSLIDVMSLAVTVSVPQGCNRLRITACAPQISTSAVAGTHMDWAISEGSTVLNSTFYNEPTSNFKLVANIIAIVNSPSAGSHTYKVQTGQSAAGSLTIGVGIPGYDSAGVAYIIVEGC